MSIVIVDEHEKRAIAGRPASQVENVAVQHLPPSYGPMFALAEPDRITQSLNHAPAQAGTPDRSRRVRPSGSRRRLRSGRIRGPGRSARCNNKTLPTNPAVAYPSRSRTSARVGNVPSSGRSQPTESSWGQRPVIMLACDGNVQGAVNGPPRRRCPCVRAVPGWAGRAIVSVKAQTGGAHGVEHDQQHVGRTGLRRGWEARACSSADVTCL